MSSCPLRQWTCTLVRMSHTRQAAGKTEIALRLREGMHASHERAISATASFRTAPLERTRVPAASHEYVNRGVLCKAVHARQMAVVVADHLMSCQLERPIQGVGRWVGRSWCVSWGRGGGGDDCPSETACQEVAFRLSLFALERLPPPQLLNDKPNHTPTLFCSRSQHFTILSSPQENM